MTVDQSDPNRGRFDPSRVGKPNLADTEPRPATSPEVAEATRAELAELRRRMTRAGEQPPSGVQTAPDLAARAAAQAAGQD